MKVSVVLFPSILLVATLACFSTQVHANSLGLLSSCDQTPYNATSGNSYWIWPNGYFGYNMTLGKWGNVLATQRSPNMYWAWWPRPSNYYTFRTSDSSTPATDVTTYTPGRWTELHLRVQDIARKWIGISLYATTGIHPINKKDIVVGSWSFPPGAPFRVREGNQTKGTGCTFNYGQTLTHINANLKPIHTRFYFTAPAGTGKVTFKLLIKQGEQNKGNFWYLPTYLTLNEGPAYVPITLPSGGGNTASGEPVVKTDKAFQTVLGNAGQACADVCLKQTPASPYCDSTRTMAINSVSTLNSAIGGQFPCQLPYIAGCMYSGAAYMAADGSCAFRSTNISYCPKMYASASPKPAVPDVCFTAAASTNRPICVCTQDRSAQPINPYQTAPRRRLLSYGQSFSEDQPSAANSATKLGLSSMIVVLIALVSTIMSRSRGMTFLVCLAGIVLAQPASAHNYIKSLHRAGEAAVSVPCQARVGNQPHVQVARDQPFEVEWSLGHGDLHQSDFWFLTVNELDYDKLAADDITDIAADYLNQSWYEKGINASIIPEGLNRVHLHNVAENNLSMSTIYKYFVSNPSNGDMRGLNGWNISASNPAYVPRDPVYMKYAHPSQYKIAGQQVESKFLPEYYVRDQRASYQSQKYPWIVAASHFYNFIEEHTTVVDQADLARFSIPSWAPPGNYIVYFNWYGYKDCVDINVPASNNQVSLRYGAMDWTSTGYSTAVKLDHCEFTYIGYFVTPCQVMDPVTMDASLCLQQCNTHSIQYSPNGCRGVQVVRITNPAGTLAQSPNIPWTDAYIPFPEEPGNLCASPSAHQRPLDGCPPNRQCNATAMGLKDDAYICFGVIPLRDTNFQVEDDFAVYLDKEEPAYYSTCLVLDPDRGFQNIPVTPNTNPSWRTSETCVSCAFQSSIKNYTRTQAPNWALSSPANQDMCGNCDQANSNLPVSTWDPLLAGSDKSTAGRIDAQQAVFPSSSSSSGGSGSSTATPSTAASSTATSSTVTTSSTAASSTAAPSSSTATTSSTAATSPTGTDLSSTASSSSTTDSSSTASTSSSSSSTGPSVETQAIKMTVRLNIDWNTVDDAWKTSFVNSVASSLGVVASRVKILAEQLVTTDTSKRSSTKRSSRALLATAAVDLDFMILPSEDGSGPTVASAAQDFTNQLANPNSALITSSVGSYFDKTVAAQQVGVSQCSNGAYVTPCPGDDGGSSSGISTLTLILIIVGAVVGLLIVGVLIFFVCKSRSASLDNHKTMSKMAADSVTHRASTV